MSPPTRLALLVPALFGGGAERLMSQLATRWNSQGFEVHLVTWAATSTDHYSIPDAVIRHGLGMLAPSRGWWSGMVANWQRVKRLRETLQGIQPQLVVSFCDQMNIVALEACWDRFPVLIAEHSNPERQRLRFPWEWWRSLRYPGCQACVALSAEIADYMSRWMDRSQLVVIPPAIDPPQLAQVTGAVAKESHRLLFVGRLSHEKGVDILIEAWRRVTHELPAWTLRVVGDGTEKESLMAQAREMQSVEFSGWQTDPWAAYRSADLFVLPSRYEGFPVALMEALSQGLTCVATNCTSALAVLDRQQRCVRIVPVEDVEALANALVSACKQIESHPDLIHRQGQCRELVKDFTWEQVGKDWDMLLSRTLNATRKR
ncbi:MAG: glycosyltransferase [Planctomycetales bacterium]|nr:glycosyltransferase [Planctomycetales bacterium]